MLAYERGKHDNNELRDFKVKGVFDKWLLGFQLEVSSAFYFFERELYKSAIIETILFLCILVPYIIVQICAGLCLGLVSLWRYCYIIGGALELLALFLLFCLICLSPLVTDMYNRISEKTERMLNGETDVNPQSSPRCTGGCLLFIIVYVVTGLFEFVILFPIALFCVICLIFPPLGIVLLLIYSSFVRSWGSFKIVFLRHGYDYLGLIKFFFLTPEVVPFYMGIGTGYMCMKRVLRQFPGGGLLSHIVTIVSATRFYHFYVLNDCTLPDMQEQQQGGDNTAFLAQPPLDQQQQQPGMMMGGQQQQNMYPAAVQQQPTISYAEQGDLKTDF